VYSSQQSAKVKTSFLWKLGKLGTLPNGMKIGHNPFPHKGFSHFVSGAVEAVVFFGPAFDGTRLGRSGTRSRAIHRHAVLRTGHGWESPPQGEGALPASAPLYTLT